MSLTLNMEDFSNEDELNILMDMITIKMQDRKKEVKGVNLELVSNSVFNINYYLLNLHLCCGINKFNQKIICFNDNINKFLIKLNKTIHRTNIHKNNITNDLKKIIHDFDIFGSHYTGLNLPFSDVDIVIKENLVTRDELFIRFEEIKEAIKNYSKFKNKWIDFEIIKTSKIPLLKIFFNKINFDISFYNKNNKGVNYMNFFKYYIEKYSFIKEAIIIFKIILLNSKLNKSFNGGINSYGLCLIIISFLQTKIIQKVEIFNNIGVFIIEFMQFFINFNYKKYYILPIYDLNHQINYLIVKKNIINDEFILLDPFNLNKNVLILFSKYDQVNKLFKLLWHTILESNQNILNDILKVSKNITTLYY